jgi:3-deoxy-manno-octulosonate cytidylyltransferase (CMP-KDO synthetase)
MNAIGIIPARFHSTRLPGKPLIKIDDKPLIQHVYENASRCRSLTDLIVATDDERILEAVAKFGGKAVLTPADLPSGTDRCAAAARNLEAEIIANIQGDEPFLDPQLIDEAVARIAAHPEFQIVTAARDNIREEELQNLAVVKVLINKQQEAIYFSRQNIPYVRAAEFLTKHPALVHIGLYIYRKTYLLKFVQMQPSGLEQLEQLEQLRMLENGDRLQVVVTDRYSFGIDTPADIQHAEEVLANHGL